MSYKMIFIAGHSRGGSTLLTTLLSQLDGYWATGEMRRIWRGGYVNNELCTCGQPFRSCEFWNAVTAEAFGHLNQTDATGLANLTENLYVAKNLLPLMLPALQTKEFQKKSLRLLDAYDAMYQAIQKISGCSVLIDSSKVSAFGLLLNRMSFLDLYIIHLNRHSCAVAYSNAKKKRRLEVHWEEAYMLQRSSSYSAITWVKRNLSAESLRLLRKPYQEFKYESLAENPISILKQISSFTGREIPNSDLSPFLEDHQLTIKNSNHMFGGNPMRFQDHTKQIGIDDAWRTQMPFFQRALVTFITYPMLLGYGYL